MTSSWAVTTTTKPKRTVFIFPYNHGLGKWEEGTVYSTWRTLLGQLNWNQYDWNSHAVKPRAFGRLRSYYRCRIQSILVFLILNTSLAIKLSPEWRFSFQIHWLHDYHMETLPAALLVLYEGPGIHASPADSPHIGPLTHYGLMTPCGDIDLSQHWLR